MQPGLFTTISMAEFLLIRVIFECAPYRMLTLKNKFSGYLLALSVPISGAFIQISNYYKHKTLCNRQVFNFLLYKLRMSKPSQIAFTNTRVTFYIVLIIITAESLVQLLRFINKLRKEKKHHLPWQFRKIL